MAEAGIKDTDIGCTEPTTFALLMNNSFCHTQQTMAFFWRVIYYQGYSLAIHIDIIYIQAEYKVRIRFSECQVRTLS